ncbi:uncharacterized protein B0H18DRAFT_987287 [Fomitopsis serialis]|uniref:uncharacterized protein n=1 Tax=Fomitopsis serialis TaxID=139415 RepID=UPI00200829A8|nr:uncharacterized protein B0H18DRAFT_987279 [Neoantrodia serialis]XP_047897123.1 uncharacterized protein B0H18DRAFT_987287 [Neoantrodia serialis]KAH9932252.1 hypothetical protein B0H18DRAFT_987279 [Neoantrodia serialis]KAH9932255.1 hypothetical protein B0H18DRAFT_987287 [Neoantrodia serialis]
MRARRDGASGRVVVMLRVCIGTFVSCCIAGCQSILVLNAGTAVVVFVTVHAAGRHACCRGSASSWAAGEQAGRKAVRAGVRKAVRPRAKGSAGEREEARTEESGGWIDKQMLVLKVMLFSPWLARPLSHYSTAYSKWAATRV